MAAIEPDNRDLERSFESLNLAKLPEGTVPVIDLPTEPACRSKVASAANLPPSSVTLLSLGTFASIEVPNPYAPPRSSAPSAELPPTSRAEDLLVLSRQVEKLVVLSRELNFIAGCIGFAGCGILSFISLDLTPGMVPYDHYFTIPLALSLGLVGCWSVYGSLSGRPADRT